MFFLNLASRTVKIAGATTNPGDAWMTQIARNLTGPEEGFLRRTRYLILDRDTKYSDAFCRRARRCLTAPGLRKFSVAIP